MPMRDNRRSPRLAQRSLPASPRGLAGHGTDALTPAVGVHDLRTRYPSMRAQRDRCLADRVVLQRELNKDDGELDGLAAENGRLLASIGTVAKRGESNIRLLLCPFILKFTPTMRLLRFMAHAQRFVLNAQRFYRSCSTVFPTCSTFEKLAISRRKVIRSSCRVGIRINGVGPGVRRRSLCR